MTPTGRRRVWVALTLLSAAVVARLTLVPAAGPDTGTFEPCLLCGDYGLADFIANVLLFVPLAVSLRGVGLRPRLTVALLGVLSVSIEVAQLWIPGRDSTVGDVVANTTGAVLAVALVWWWPRRRRAWPGALVAAAAALAVIAVGGVVLRPRFPATTYYGQWTPELGQFARYRGSVGSARIGALPLRSWELPDSRAVRGAFEAGDTVVVRGVAGPAPGGLAPLFSIADDRSRTIFLLGVDGSSFVLRLSTRAPDLRLHQPDLRWPAAFAGVVPGDTLTLDVWRADPGYGVWLSGRAPRRLAYTAGDVWGLLEPLPARLAGVRPLVGPAFLAILCLPLGVLLPKRRAGLVLAAATLAGAGVLPRLTGLAWTPPLQLAALAAGTALGALVPEDR